MKCNFSKRRSVLSLEVNVKHYIIPQITRFKYLTSIVQCNGEIEGDVNQNMIKLTKYLYLKLILRSKT